MSKPSFKPSLLKSRQFSSNNQSGRLAMKKIHNPKSCAPAVYIPCWLIQVPSSILSHAAKILYGRLAQWSNERGQVFRSVQQLSLEIGASKSSIDRHIRELKDADLIGTFHPQAGGINHFEFYDHPWMHEAINENLSYESDRIDPTSKLTLPHVKVDVTPTSKLTCINRKEIEEIKDNNISPIIPLKSKVPKTSLFAENLLSDNPHSVPKDYIEQWIANRKAHKVTPIAWKRLNNTLSILKSMGIDPVDAFERMVASGWRSLEVSYFHQDMKIKKHLDSNIDMHSTEWADDFVRKTSLSGELN